MSIHSFLLTESVLYYWRMNINRAIGIHYPIPNPIKCLIRKTQKWCLFFFLFFLISLLLENFCGRNIDWSLTFHSHLVLWIPMNERFWTGRRSPKSLMFTHIHNKNIPPDDHFSRGIPVMTTSYNTHIRYTHKNTHISECLCRYRHRLPVLINRW